jgi:streptogramin lyase
MRTLVALLTLAASAASVPVAAASEVARVGLGSDITTLVPGADGAWVAGTRLDGGSFIGRAGAPVTRVRARLESGALGPDGNAWFVAGTRLLRADPRGAVAAAARLPEPGLGRYAIAPGSDGTLWARGEELVRVTPDGAVEAGPSPLPECRADRPLPDWPITDGFVRGADGVLWAADWMCERLVRLAPAGPRVVRVPGLDSELIAPDASGGLWFSANQGYSIAHVDAAGRVRTIPRTGDALHDATDVTGAPDGSAVFATGECKLVRVAPDGAVTIEQTPLPADRVAYDAQGALWLAAHTRVARLVPGEQIGACDESGPSVRFRSPSRMSLAALRRDGVRFRMSARSAVTALATYDEGRFENPRFGKRLRVLTSAVRYHISPGHLRRLAWWLAAGERPVMHLNVTATDADGNQTLESRTIDVTR